MSVEERLQLLIGQQAFQIAILSMQLEQAKTEAETLKAEALKKPAE